MDQDRQPDPRSTDSSECACALGRTEQGAFLHLRDFSNYLAPGGVREVLRIPTLVVQGILVNLVYVLPYLLIAAIVLGWSALAVAPRLPAETIGPPPPTEAMIAPPPAEETAPSAPIAAESERADPNWPIEWIALAFLVLVVYLAVALPLWQHWRELNSPQEQRWKIRDKQSNLARWGLLFFPVAFALLQPAIVWILAGDGWLALLAAVSGSGGVGLAVALGQRAAQRFPVVADKLLVIGFALLAPITLWLLTLALATWLLCPPDWIPFSEEVLRSCAGRSLTDASVFLTAIYIAVAVLASYYAFRILDTNKTSFHAFYRDRLSKAYLFDPYRHIRKENDDSEADSAEVGVRHTDRIWLSDLPARAPYHLINAAINIQDAKTKNTRGRNADGFLFSRLYCGGELTGYCETDVLEGIDPHLDLATAMAISGAAVAPGMGVNTNRA